MDSMASRRRQHARMASQPYYEVQAQHIATQHRQSTQVTRSTTQRSTCARCIMFMTTQANKVRAGCVGACHWPRTVGENADMMCATATPISSPGAS